MMIKMNPKGCQNAQTLGPGVLLVASYAVSWHVRRLLAVASCGLLRVQPRRLQSVSTRASVCLLLDSSLSSRVFRVVFWCALPVGVPGAPRGSFHRKNDLPVQSRRLPAVLPVFFRCSLPGPSCFCSGLRSGFRSQCLRSRLHRPSWFKLKKKCTKKLELRCSYCG